MPTITNSIGSAGGRDYSTLAAWAAALPANLVSDGNSYVGQCYNDGEFTAASNLLTISGHTTDSTHTITLTTGAGQSFRDNANVQTNALNYNVANGVGLRVTADGSDYVISISGQYITIANLQIFNNSGTHNGINISGGSHNVRISNCIVKSDGTSPIINQDNSNTFDNCVLIKTSTGGALFEGWGHTAYFMTLVFPSDVGSPGYGVYNYGDASTWENAAFFGVFSVLNGSNVTFTTCATDVASPPSGVTGSLTYANQFQNTTVAGGNYRIKSGADLVGAGTADSTHGASDIAGTTRPQGGNWDIGCWQSLVAAGGQIVADTTMAIEDLLRAATGIGLADESLGGARNDPGIADEFVAGGRSDPSIAAEFTVRMAGDGGVPTESLAQAVIDRGVSGEWLVSSLLTSATPFEFISTLVGEPLAPVEFEGEILFVSERAVPIEWLGSLLLNRELPIEALLETAADRRIAMDWLAPAILDTVSPGEFTAWLAGDEFVPIEFEGNILPISDRILPIEWSALPAMARVSVERLLASPSKRRILGTVGRIRLLKRQ